MAAPHEIAAYRDAGHSVAETCEYFGIKDRAVYKACQLARAHHQLDAPGPRHSDTRRPRRHQPVRRTGTTYASSSSLGGDPGSDGIPVQGHALEQEQRPEPPHFRDVASDDDIAGDTTYWKCPVTGELLPIIPGVGRKRWNAERIALHQRLASLREPVPAAPAPEVRMRASDSADAPAAVPQQSALQSESAPVPLSDAAPRTPAPSTPAPTALRQLEPIVIVKRYPLPRQAGPTLTSWLSLGEYLPPPNIILALAVVLLLILVCSW